MAVWCDDGDRCSSGFLAEGDMLSWAGSSGEGVEVEEGLLSNQMCREGKGVRGLS